MSWWRKKEHPPSEATRARERAEQRLEETRARTPDFMELGDRLRDIREANHLTQLFVELHRRR